LAGPALAATYGQLGDRGSGPGGRVRAVSPNAPKE